MKIQSQRHRQRPFKEISEKENTNRRGEASGQKPWNSHVNFLPDASPLHCPGRNAPFASREKPNTV